VGCDESAAFKPRFAKETGGGYSPELTILSRLLRFLAGSGPLAVREVCAC
jgi:hypothetical protein